uniref:Uncharacterized protein n=1 Tax=Chromera velia CCMP2878 TaxID=1169474 RepID=A0A0G4FLE9_9ALVE|eukprot:Cvel_17634.t1-p1 / transcript=Cvel_17634.t1 / gene=Cvel_17634 / organism=Chromera_velia_CCMP2878 / gene_product=hypothetical protein / transcript_product=hypothetical protein / location=Cvel_scaffold1419:41103-41471(-) / protein_length=123 / sequence_SO=supercontig / SO=protein_coding / is_pseudo=false
MWADRSPSPTRPSQGKSKRGGKDAGGKSKKGNGKGKAVSPSTHSKTRLAGYMAEASSTSGRGERGNRSGEFRIDMDPERGGNDLKKGKKGVWGGKGKGGRDLEAPRKGSSASSILDGEGGEER